MTLISSRIKRLEDSLATKERALFWLETAKADGGFIRYSEVGYTRPEEKAWISTQQAFFLHDLVCKLNMAPLDYRDTCWPQLRWLHIALHQSIQLCAIAGKGDEILETIKSEFVSMMEDTFAFREAVAEISDTYFDGHQVLFEETAALLESTIGQFRQISADFNQAAETLELDRIEVDEVSEACCAYAQRYCDEFVRLAHSAALLWTGDSNAALRQLCPTHCYHRLLGQPCPE